MIEGCTENNIPLKIHFIDIRAAFDSVRRNYIWQALKQYGLPHINMYNTNMSKFSELFTLIV